MSLRLQSISLNDGTWEARSSWFLDTYFTAVDGEIQNTVAVEWRKTDRSKREDLRMAFESLLSQPEKTCLLIAFLGEEPVGYFLGLVKDCIAEIPSKIGYINGLYVVSGMRKQGIAGALYQKGVDWFQERAIEHFELYVPLKSHDAIRFWSQRGFIASDQIMNMALKK